MDVPVRFWIALMIFFTTFTNHMLRSSFSISILRMVNNTEISYLSDICKHPTPTKPHPFITNEPRFNWSEVTEGIVLGSYLWSYLIISFAAGPIIAYFGPSSAIFYSSVSAALLNAIIPAAAVFSPWVVGFLRALMGGLASVEYPATYELISQWAPQDERSRFLSAMMGGSIGVIFAWVTVGFVTYYIAWSWAFYILTFITLVFVIVFAFVTTDNPLEHKWVKAEELSHILENQDEGILEGSTTRKTRTIWPPYRKMLRSGPFWAITVAHIGYLWAVVLSVTYMPKYLSNPLGFDILNIGIFSSVPYIAYFMFLIVFGWLGDCCRGQQSMSIIRIRKSTIILSHFAPACCFFIMVSVECSSHKKLITLLFCAHIFGAAVVIGHFQSIHDIAPHFVGAVSGVIFSISGIAGIETVLHSLLLSWIADSLQASRVIFSICGSILVVTGIAFMIFAKADVQPWDNVEEHHSINERH